MADTSSKPSPHFLASLVVVASTIAVWMLVGQLSEEPSSDYIIRVPQLSRWMQLLLGVAAISTAGAAVAELWSRHRPWLVESRWWPVYGRLLAAGLLAAGGGRMITAGTNGANIGGALFLYFGPLLVIYLLGRARMESVWIRHGNPGWFPTAFEWVVLGGALFAAALISGILRRD